MPKVRIRFTDKITGKTYRENQKYDGDRVEELCGKGFLFLPKEKKEIAEVKEKVESPTIKKKKKYGV